MLCILLKRGEHLNMLDQPNLNPPSKPVFSELEYPTTLTMCMFWLLVLHLLVSYPLGVFNLITKAYMIQWIDLTRYETKVKLLDDFFLNLINK